MIHGVKDRAELQPATGLHKEQRPWPDIKREFKEDRFMLWGVYASLLFFTALTDLVD